VIAFYWTAQQQQQALDILQFKLDILWTMLDAMTMAYIHETPPFHNCRADGDEPVAGA